MQSDTRSRCLSVLSTILVQEAELGTVDQGGGLYASPSLDSLALVNLIVALENEFAIQIDTEDPEKVFADLDTLVTYLDDKRV